MEVKLIIMIGNPPVLYHICIHYYYYYDFCAFLCSSPIWMWLAAITMTIASVWPSDMPSIEHWHWHPKRFMRLHFLKKCKRNCIIFNLFYLYSTPLFMFFKKWSVDFLVLWSPFLRYMQSALIGQLHSAFWLANHLIHIWNLQGLTFMLGESSDLI